MKETLTLWSYGKRDLTVTVEYVAIGKAYENDLKAYDVLIDGESVGQVRQVLANTTSPIRGSRLVKRNRGTIQWAWSRPRTSKDKPGIGPVYNYPGLYALSRRTAVAEIMGYDMAKKV